MDTDTAITCTDMPTVSMPHHMPSSKIFIKNLFINILIYLLMPAIFVLFASAN